MQDNFIAYSRLYKTYSFGTIQEVNIFIENNQEYGYIGQKNGRYHVAKLNDKGIKIWT